MGQLISLAQALESFLKDNPRFAQQSDINVEAVLKNDADIQAFWQREADQLAPDALQRSMGNLFEFVRQKEAIANGKPALYPGYIPVLENEKGYPIVSYRPTEATRLSQQQAARLTTYHVAKAATRANLQALRADYQNDQERAQAFVAVVNVLQKLRQADGEYVQGLFLYGDFGVGKTYLLGALANELIKHDVDVMMLHVPTLLSETQRQLGNKAADGSQQLEQLVEQAKTTQVLMLDDLGAESLSAWFRDSVLAMILEYRMQNELTTFITSNFDFKGLETHLANTRDAVEPVKAARLMQRIAFLTQPVVMGGKSRRLGSDLT